MLSKISNINKFRYLVSLYFVLAILDYYIMVDPMGTGMNFYPRVWVRV
jgi:hypothetical protein